MRDAKSVPYHSNREQCHVRSDTEEKEFHDGSELLHQCKNLCKSCQAWHSDVSVDQSMLERLPEEYSRRWSPIYTPPFHYLNGRTISIPMNSEMDTTDDDWTEHQTIEWWNTEKKSRKLYCARENSVRRLPIRSIKAMLINYWRYILTGDMMIGKKTRKICWVKTILVEGRIPGDALSFGKGR